MRISGHISRKSCGSLINFNSTKVMDITTKHSHTVNLMLFIVQQYKIFPLRVIVNYKMLTVK